MSSYDAETLSSALSQIKSPEDEVRKPAEQYILEVRRVAPLSLVNMLIEIITSSEDPGIVHSALTIIIRDIEIAAKCQKTAEQDRIDTHVPAIETIDAFLEFLLALFAHNDEFIRNTAASVYGITANLAMLIKADDSEYLQVLLGVVQESSSEDITIAACVSIQNLIESHDFDDDVLKQLIEVFFPTLSESISQNIKINIIRIFAVIAPKYLEIFGEDMESLSQLLSIIFELTTDPNLKNVCYALWYILIDKSYEWLEIVPDLIHLVMEDSASEENDPENQKLALAFMAEVAEWESTLEEHYQIIESNSEEYIPVLLNLMLKIDTDTFDPTEEEPFNIAASTLVSFLQVPDVATALRDSLTQFVSENAGSGDPVKIEVAIGALKALVLGLINAHIKLDQEGEDPAGLLNFCFECISQTISSESPRLINSGLCLISAIIPNFPERAEFAECIPVVLKILEEGPQELKTPANEAMELLIEFSAFDDYAGLADHLISTGNPTSLYLANKICQSRQTVDMIVGHSEGLIEMAAAALESDSFEASNAAMALLRTLWASGAGEEIAQTGFDLSKELFDAGREPEALMTMSSACRALNGGHNIYAQTLASYVAGALAEDTEPELIKVALLAVAQNVSRMEVEGLFASIASNILRLLASSFVAGEEIKTGCFEAMAQLMETQGEALSPFVPRVWVIVKSAASQLPTMAYERDEMTNFTGALLECANHTIPFLGEDDAVDVVITLLKLIIYGGSLETTTSSFLIEWLDAIEFIVNANDAEAIQTIRSEEDVCSLIQEAAVRANTEEIRAGAAQIAGILEIEIGGEEA